jgi:Zn-dependent protease with chaperone function
VGYVPAYDSLCRLVAREGLQLKNVERWLLACTGAGAQALWYVVMAGPLAAGVAVGLLWYGTSTLWVAVIAGVVFVFFSWVASPASILIGRIVTAGEAPALFEAIERLRVSLDAAPIQRVLLTDELNAAAHQSGRLGLPWPIQQTLILGIPLLSVLRTQEAVAVIAHELGHFSRRHGLFGHWIYRTRLMWLALAHPAQPDDSPYERAVQWFASIFAPWFGRRAFAFSRQCEYEADRDAAQAASARDLVQALHALDVAVQRMKQWPQRPEFQAQRHVPNAPSDRWTAMLAAISRTPFAANETQATRSRSATTDDTHPSLAERAAALNVQWADLQDQLPASSDCAGSAWFGPRWTSELATMDVAWWQFQQSVWRADSVHLRHLARCLDALVSSNAQWTQCIVFLQALDRVDEVLALAPAVNDIDPTVPVAHAFLALRARLEAGDAQAAPLLEKLIAREPALAYPVRDALLAHATARADAAQIEKHRVLRGRAYRSRLRAAALVHNIIERGELLVPRLNTEALSAFDEQCIADPALRRAWLGACDVATDDGRAFRADVLVIQIDPDLMRSAGDDEDDVQDRYWRQLDRWMEGPQVLTVVRTCFTTEQGLPSILDRSAACQWRRAQSLSVGAPMDYRKPRAGTMTPMLLTSTSMNNAEPTDTSPVHEPTLWRDNGWTARVIKNNDDDGWAVEMIKAGEAEPALVGPWTMGRDKKNPKPLDSAAFNTLVKTASEVLRRHEQQLHALLHKSVFVAGISGGRIEVTLEIVPDDDDAHAVLKATDADGTELARERVPATFKLNPGSAAAWVEGGFAKPR